MCQFDVVENEYDGESTDFTATVIPVRGGVSGDYFFSQHFGVGVEGGLQFAFVTNLESDGDDIDANFGTNMMYGALHATFVL